MKKEDEWKGEWDDWRDDPWEEIMDDDSRGSSSFVSRVLASKIDGIVVGILFIVFFLTVMIMSILDLGFLFYFYFFPFYMAYFIFGFMYFVILESAFGTTVGKSFAGIGVIHSDGNKPSLRTSMIRNLERLIWPIPVLGQIIFYMSIKCIEHDKQRWGDQMADTFVVSKPMKIC